MEPYSMRLIRIYSDINVPSSRGDNAAFDITESFYDELNRFIIREGALLLRKHMRVELVDLDHGIRNETFEDLTQMEAIK